MILELFYPGNKNLIGIRCDFGISELHPNDQKRTNGAAAGGDLQPAAGVHHAPPGHRRVDVSDEQRRFGCVFISIF